MILYGIFEVETRRFVKELPSKVDDGGEAMLVYTSHDAAEQRAQKHFGQEGASKRDRNSVYRVVKFLTVKQEYQ